MPGDEERQRLADLARQLRRLHTGEEMLVLPNAWDAGSAKVVEAAGFPAVATASAAVTAVLGHEDGEQAPPDEMFAAGARIARAVAVPVTLDAEGGYGLPPGELVDRLLDAGVVGCNLEDGDHRTGGLKDAGPHAEWLAAVRAEADARGVPIVINARVDVFLPSSPVPLGERVREALRRGRLYLEAGADCVYPIGIGDRTTLEQVVVGLHAPVNANSGPGLSLDVLRATGVARVSYGPRFYRAALADFGRSITRL